jgi:hypothetical protein
MHFPVRSKGLGTQKQLTKYLCNELVTFSRNDVQNYIHKILNKNKGHHHKLIGVPGLHKQLAWAGKSVIGGICGDSEGQVPSPG